MKSEEKNNLLQINLTHLEDEAAEQAGVLRMWCDKLAKAEKMAKLAKRKLRLTKAELARVIRKSPSKYGIFKLTEDSIMDVIVAMSQYKEDELVQIQSEYDRDVIKSMVTSLHERGEQIGNEVKLHGQQYWARPRGDLGAVREENREETMRRASKDL